MKKWLVGLMAAGLCASNAWAASYTLVTSLDGFGEGNYVITGEKAEGEEHAMLNEVDSGDFIHQQADAATIVDGVISDPDASVVWTVAEAENGWTIYNEAAGGYVKWPGGTKNKATTEATVTDASTWTISFDGGVSTVDNVGTPGRKLQYNKSTPRFACYTGVQTPLKFYKEGSLEFSVEVEPSGEFRQNTGEWVLTEGTSGAILTAVAKNGEGDVSYAWSGAFEGSNEILPIPDGLTVDDVPAGYTVTVTATDSSEPPQTATAEFSFTLVQAPQAYTVTIDDGIENGTVQLFDGETEMANGEAVYEGTTVKVVATPADRSFKVESVGVAATDDPSTTVPLENGEFTMPGFNVTVTAAFAPWEGTAYALVESMDDFEAGADYLVVAGTDAMKNESDSGRIAVSAVEITDGVVETEDEAIVWTIDNGSEGKYTLYNAAANVYVSAPSYESTGAASLVGDGTAAEAQWTLSIAGDSLATIGSVYDGISLLRNSSHPYFAAYKGGTKPSLYKKVGAGVFSISLDPSGEDVVFTEGEGGTVTATPKNAQGEVIYEWNVTEDGTPGSAEGNVWTIPADAPAGGPWTLYCTANDGTTEADASVSFSITAAPVVYEVTVDEGIENGTVTVDPASGVAGTQITVSATPDDGFLLVDILVNGEPIDGNTFALPEGGATVGATFEAKPPRQGFSQITSLDELEAGEYVLVGSDKNGSYGAIAELTGSTTVLSAGTVTIQDGVVENPLDSQIWTLSQSEDGWTIYHKDLGYLGYTGNKNSAMAEEEASTNSTWTFSMAGDLFKVSNVGTEGRTLRYNYNSGSPRFACYASDTLVNIALYKNFGGAFSIALDPADDFEVVAGEEFSIEATPKNAVGAVTYAWTVDGVPAETAGSVLALVAGEAGETQHVVVCTATDAGAEEGAEPATATVSYTVVAAPGLFTVTVADGIENGTVALSVAGEPLETPAEVEEGTEVTVEATPADGYELESITVNGEVLEGTTTFTVTEDAEVSATFAKTVDYATLPFLAEDTPFTGKWKNSKEPGVTSEGLDNDYTDGAAKLIANDTWVQIKFQGTPGELVYTLKGNGTSADCEFAVQESATGADGDWTPLATFTGENALPTAKSTFTNALSADSRFVRFLYVTKAAGNVALYDVYISAGGFSVSLDLEDGAEIEQGAEVAVTATPKNAVGEVTYAWTVDGVDANTQGDVLTLDTSVVDAEGVWHEVKCVATDTGAEGATAEAGATYRIVEPPPTFTVDFADGIVNGTIAIFVDGAEVEMPAQLAAGAEVTVVATPVAGYKVGEISVNLTVLTGDSFTVAEDATIYASFVERGDEFVKITGVEELEEGDYVITGAKAAGEEYAMLAELSDGNKTYIKPQEKAVEIENGNTIAGPDASIVWAVEKVADGWTIHNEAIGFVGYVASDNTAGAEEEASEKSTWMITESGGLFLLQNVGNTGRYLLYNSGSPRFACYTSASSSIKALAFYKKAGPAVFGVSVSDTEFELKQGEPATVTATAKNGAEPYSFVWTSETPELNGTGAELAIPDTLEAGEYAATVTATDSSEPPQTDTATVEFTVVAPLPVFAITVADGIENGTVEVDKAEAEQGETVTVTATPAENFKLVAILVNGEPIEGNTFEAAGDSVVSATFAPIVKYPVTIDDAIEHGTVAADKAEAEAGETVTLTANPDDGWKLDTFLLNGAPIEGNSFEMPEGEALVSAAFAETVLVTFVPVTDEAEFAVGEEYLLVAVKEDAFTSAMKNASSGSRIGVDAVEIAEDGSITTDNADIVWTIRAGTEEGEYVLFSESGGVYAAGPASSGNNAQLVADGTDALAQWTLDFSALPEVKIASVSYDGRWLQRNGDKNNAYFATYTGSQVNPLLYKKAGFSVAFDKEDGFTVDEGTADSITAAAVRGVEPYHYTWTSATPALNGEGATLVIPGTLWCAETPYSVTVTATDSSEPPQTASKTITFEVLPPAVRFAVTVANGIEGGEVTVDKAQAEPGEEVTVTATPDAGYELVAITVDGTPIAGDTFEMPAKDVEVSATFAEILDYATLPFVEQDTPYSGPWYNAELPVGMTADGLGSDYNDGSAKFNDSGDWLQVKFQGEPGQISFGLKGNGTSETDVSTFVVLESADGENWQPLATYATQVAEGDETTRQLSNAKRDDTFALSSDSRFVKFLYQEKDAGNVGLYYVYISAAGEEEPSVTVDGATRVTLGGTFELALALENYTGDYEWAWAPETVGYVDPDTATFWWTPAAIGETEVTFSAMDGDRTIASETVTLTVGYAPALVFEGGDGMVGEPATVTVTAENTADPTVTFLGLEAPEGSALTDEDVEFDPETGKATFTPDVEGDYGLGFSAGTREGGDYIDDLWIITVKGEPDVVFSGDDTGTTGQAVRFSVAATLPGGAVDFDDYLWNFPDESSLTDEDVAIDAETGEVTFTPDVPGEYEFGFALVGGRELFYWAVTVDGEPPAPEQPVITMLAMDPETRTIMLEYTGDATEVWGTDDLTEKTDQWRKIEGAIVDNVDKEAFTEMEKMFLRLQ